MNDTAPDTPDTRVNATDAITQCFQTRQITADEAYNVLRLLGSHHLEALCQSDQPQLRQLLEALATVMISNRLSKEEFASPQLRNYAIYNGLNQAYRDDRKMHVKDVEYTNHLEAITEILTEYPRDLDQAQEMVSGAGDTLQHALERLQRASVGVLPSTTRAHVFSTEPTGLYRETAAVDALLGALNAIRQYRAEMER